MADAGNIIGLPTPFDRLPPGVKEALSHYAEFFWLWHEAPDSFLTHKREFSRGMAGHVALARNIRALFESRATQYAQEFYDRDKARRDKQRVLREIRLSTAAAIEQIKADALKKYNAVLAQ